MEKTNINKLETENINSILNLTNRKKLTLTGISEIISSNETSILLKIKNTKLFITGKDINITKLDIENGLLEANGTFDSLKYDKQNTNFIKRLFK